MPDRARRINAIYSNSQSLQIFIYGKETTTTRIL